MARVVLTGALATALMVALAGPVWAPPYVTSISGNSYSPQNGSVVAAAALAWKNDDAVTHTATANRPFRVFNTGDIAGAGTISSPVFPAGPGRYPYHCAYHSNMTGTMDLKPAAYGTFTVGADVTIDFAWADAPKGMDREIQQRREGGTWKTIYKGRAVNEIVRQFASTGNYQVRGRMVIRKNDVHTKWSSATFITIT